MSSFHVIYKGKKTQTPRFNNLLSLPCAFAIIGLGWIAVYLFQNVKEQQLSIALHPCRCRRLLRANVGQVKVSSAAADLQSEHWRCSVDDMSEEL